MWKDLNAILDILNEALIDENMEILMVSRQKNQDDLDIVPNHRYTIRQNKPEEVVVAKIHHHADHSRHNEKENLDKTSKKPTRERREKLTEAQIEEQKRKHIEEEEKKMEEERLKKKLIEEEQKLLDIPKPKNLSNEELDAYMKKYEAI